MCGSPHDLIIRIKRLNHWYHWIIELNQKETAKWSVHFETMEKRYRDLLWRTRRVAEAATGVVIKKVFLKIPQILLENTCVGL